MNAAEHPQAVQDHSAEVKQISLPLSAEAVAQLRAGDLVELSGVLYTARDAAHQRLVDLIDQDKPLPLDLAGACIYYVGPTPSSPERITGSAGPTTSARMDGFAPALIKHGLRGMVGKGNRSPEVVKAMVTHGCVYFAAIGGAGALIAKCITKLDVVAWPELGCEALRRLEVSHLPVVVAIDALGSSLYQR